MFCPVCEAEYVEGITNCPEDDVDLVEELPERQPHEHHEGQPREQRGDRREFLPPDAVVVYRLAGQAELGEPRAELIRAALEENGIAVAVAGEYTPPPVAFSTALGPAPVEILVSRGDAERAREIIAEVEQSLTAGNDEGDVTGG